LGGPLHTQDAGNDTQDLFQAPLALVHKQSSNLIQILATEVRIQEKTNLIFLFLRTTKTIQFHSKFQNNKPTIRFDMKNHYSHSTIAEPLINFYSHNS